MSGEAAAYDGLRMNQIQVIGSHNSYKRGIEPALFALMLEHNPGVKSLEYAHLSIVDQLNLGLRNLEIDVYHDPEGGAYTLPAGLRALEEQGIEPQPFDEEGVLQHPGFKVMHIADYDFRSWHLLLRDQLVEMRAWSEANPGHLPIVVTVNCKEGRGGIDNTREILHFDQAAFDALDAALIAGLGRDRLLIPDDVRGDAKTIEEAIRSTGWPSVGDAAGRFLFVLDHGGSTRDTYVAGHEGLLERVFFTLSEPGSGEAAFMVINDPKGDFERIRDMVSKGYMVRTRADSGTNEARRGDFSRFQAAKASGAQVITTDYYIPDLRMAPNYFIRFDDGGFVRVKGR
ncbi:hypothetical protein Pan265_23500 [Mucisphaera calidilacus]|uniref:Uncharacterized protein n=2 Tax=Mucisphaera calidilacus TaxID=2527982 RepID=A0A518BZT8_9BACT|nr:hypothetical protein Pan265_23500 [Mucisphaera calidilacus]